MNKDFHVHRQQGDTYPWLHCSSNCMQSFLCWPDRATPQKAGALRHIWVVLASGKMLRLVLPLMLSGEF